MSFRVLRRAALALAVLVALLYAGAVGYLVASETSIVFDAAAPGGSRTPAAPFEQVSSRRDDGTTQLTWVMQQPGNAGQRPWVVFLHGKGAPVSARMNIVHYEHLRALGLNVIAPEYRGYSGTGGVPTEAAVERDGRSGYDYLVRTLHVPPSHIVIFGWSLGSAVAVDLASRVPAAAVILEGAPSSLVDVGALRYPFIPVRLLMRNPFDSVAKIGRITAPLLFLHSPVDAVVPIDEGRRLFAAARGPKEFVQVQGGHVYAAERDPAFFGYVRRFLIEQHMLAGQAPASSGQ
jgi:fermentation-respiration switch protein FrsA (DUF1100 family)